MGTLILLRGGGVEGVRYIGTFHFRTLAAAFSPLLLPLTFRFHRCPRKSNWYICQINCQCHVHARLCTYTHTHHLNNIWTCLIMLINVSIRILLSFHHVMSSCFNDRSMGESSFHRHLLTGKDLFSQMWKCFLLRAISSCWLDVT